MQLYYLGDNKVADIIGIIRVIRRSNMLWPWSNPTQHEESKEIDETGFNDLVSSSTGKIKQFLMDNPRVVYKGIPLLMVIYLFYPILLTGLYWFPWIWATIEVYNRIPAGTIPITTEMAKQFLSCQRSGRLTLNM